jgi:hypothetical protein
VITSLFVAALLAAEPETAAAGPRVETAALVEGKLPDAPGKVLVETKCLICHSREYVTQQRLTPAQWTATVAKMRKFGSPLSDEEVPVLSEYLGRYWTVELPERAPKPVRAPRGAVK